MNKWLNLVIVTLAMIINSACTSSKSTISNNANLANYEYASIINNDTYHIPAELMEYEILLFDAVESSRLRLVNEALIYRLSLHKQERLLLVKYAVDIKESETIVTVNFIDYLTGRPVASCRGAYGLGLSYDGDLKGAIKKVAEQISETFPK